MSWSSQWSFSFWFSHQYPICIPLLLHSCYMPRPSDRMAYWANNENYNTTFIQWHHTLIRIILCPAGVYSGLSPRWVFYSKRDWPTDRLS
jgi:hypothetical protein